MQVLLLRQGFNLPSGNRIAAILPTVNLVVSMALITTLVNSLSTVQYRIDTDTTRFVEVAIYLPRYLFTVAETTRLVFVAIFIPNVLTTDTATERLACVARLKDAVLDIVVLTVKLIEVVIVLPKDLAIEVATDRAGCKAL